MTPQERKLVDELFERLAMLETRPREPDAEQAIMAGLRKAPNATYALVQTVLLQDEALRSADERIRELEGGDADAPQQQGGFLDSMRDAVFGVASPDFRAGGGRQRSPDGRAVRLSHRQRLSAERRRLCAGASAAASRRRRIVPRHGSRCGSRRDRRHAC